MTARSHRDRTRVSQVDIAIEIVCIFIVYFSRITSPIFFQLSGVRDMFNIIFPVSG